MRTLSKSKRLHVHCSGIGICANVQLPRHNLRPVRLHLAIVNNGEPVLQTKSKVFDPRDIVILGHTRNPRADAGALIRCHTRTALLVVLLLCKQLQQCVKQRAHARTSILVATNAVEPVTLLHNLSSKYLPTKHHNPPKRWSSHKRHQQGRKVGAV